MIQERGDNLCHECDDGYTHLRDFGQTDSGKQLLRCANGHIVRWDNAFAPTWILDAPMVADCCHSAYCLCEFCKEKPNARLRQITRRLK